ncbi:MAG: hypothetical protein GTO17_04055 [Candidatus Aminicenantes bacterium]|nr:hypothetical protein [Candidatus Aminicenantes bacterium]
MFQKALKILEARVGIETNEKALLPQFPLKTEVQSLLTDFNDVQEIPYSSDLDGYVSVKEEQTPEASVEFSAENLKLRGPFIEFTKEDHDKRFSLWGNQGLLFRYLLFLLETRHQIFSIHGCALFKEEHNRLYVVVGSAGSGKTVYLLSGLEKGLKLFSVELVHFRIYKGSLEWLQGALIDSVRIGTLRHHFPRFKPDIRLLETKDQWQEKIALDLSAHKSKKEAILNPEIMMIFPRIEVGWPGFQRTSIEEKRKTVNFIFDNISQKIAETVILYDKILLTGFDNPKNAQTRFNTVNELTQHNTFITAASVISSPHECWGNLLEKTT